MTTAKTAAIKLAQKETGKPIRRSATDWVFYAPYEVGGYDSEIRETSYKHAIKKRAGWVAELALRAMGKWDEAAQAAIDCELRDYYGARGANNLVDCGLAAFGQGASPADLAKAAQDYWDEK